MIIAKSIVNGETLPGNGHSQKVYNPSNLHEEIGTIHHCTTKDVDAALDASKEAFVSWKKTNGMEINRILYNMASVLDHHSEEIAETGSKEMGKPINEMAGEVKRGVHLLNYYAAEAIRPNGDMIPSSANGVLQYSKRVPLGVTGIITPWNFPVAIPVWKMAPALACGNTVVWKPAENGALTAMKLMEIFSRSDLPQGVINLIIGKGREVGDHLLESNKLNGLSFTGSTAVGTNIASKCALNNIKFQTEMGGKNAAVILKDADLDKAIPAVISGSFTSAGQKCTASSRIIVEKSILEDFRQKFVKAMEKIKQSYALDKEAFLGPVASKEQFDKVTEYWSLAKNEGHILYEGSVPDGTEGYFIPPVIVDQIDSQHQLFKDEIFGPVTSIVPVDNLEEAVDVCNDSIYGLSASVFTQNLAAAHYFLDNVEVGMARVNQETAGVEFQAPFGGMKMSSSHTREQGQAAMAFYSQIKTYSIKYS